MSSLPEQTAERDQATGPRHNLVLVVFAVSIAVYFNALFNGFVFDDISQVVQNPWIKNIKYVPELFITNVWAFRERISNYYRPFMSLTYMVSYHLFGLRPWGFHLVNVLFHAGVSILVYRTGSLLFRQEPSAPYLSPAFVAALLFATHPIHTEVVTAIMGIPDLGFTFFYLFSFYFYVRSEKGPRLHYWISVLSFFVATLYKEPALTLPVLLLAYDHAFNRGKLRPINILLRYGPFVAAAGVYLIMRFLALGDFITATRRAELSTYQYLINALPLFSQYMEKLFFPINLNLLHVFRPMGSMFETRTLLSLASTMGFLCVMWIAAKKGKTAFLGLSLIALALLPVLYIPALNLELQNVFAERYLYLPSLGFVLLVASFTQWLETHAPKRIVPLYLVLGVLVGLYSAGTIQRNAVWKDNYSLFSDAVRKVPDSVVAHEYLGYALYSQRRLDEAVAEYQIVLGLDKNRPNTHHNLGVIYAIKGWTDKAINEYKIALRLNPDLAEARSNLGLALLNKGSIEEGIDQLRIALRLNPYLPEAHHSLGVAHAMKGLVDEAIDEFRIASKLNPHNKNFQEDLLKMVQIRNSILQRETSSPP